MEQYPFSFPPMGMNNPDGSPSPLGEVGRGLASYWLPG